MRRRRPDCQDMLKTQNSSPGKETTPGCPHFAGNVDVFLSSGYPFSEVQRTPLQRSEAILSFPHSFTISSSTQNLLVMSKVLRDTTILSSGTCRAEDLGYGLRSPAALTLKQGLWPPPPHCSFLHLPQLWQQSEGGLEHNHRSRCGNSNVLT